jgi:cobalt-zinc-cadmium resistance protein CzcA
MELLNYQNLLNSSKNDLSIAIGISGLDYDFNPEVGQWNDTVFNPLNETLFNYYHSNVSSYRKAQSYEKSKLMPEFSVGYFNQSIDNTKGFDGVMLEASIPLGAILNRKESRMAGINTKIAQQNSQMQIEQIQLSYQSSLQNYQALLNLYTSDAQKWNIQANELIDLVGKELKNGSENYFYYVQLYTQAMQQKLNYFELMKKLQQAKAELNFYTL